MIVHTGFSPLPRALCAPSASIHRRTHVDRHILALPALDAFNTLRGMLDPTCQPLAPDQLATAARVLCRQASSHVPACVAERIQAALLAARAVGDRAWQCPESVVDVLHRVVDYMHSRDDLIPDRLPTVGRLDDVLIIEAAWPQLFEEVIAYRDYRTLRAWLRADQPTRAKTFDRAAWLDMRRAQADARCRAREALDASYITPACTTFRVH